MPLLNVPNPLIVEDNKQRNRRIELLVSIDHLGQFHLGKFLDSVLIRCHMLGFAHSRRKEQGEISQAQENDVDADEDHDVQVHGAIIIQSQVGNDLISRDASKLQTLQVVVASASRWTDSSPRALHLPHIRSEPQR